MTKRCGFCGAPGHEQVAGRCRYCKTPSGPSARKVVYSEADLRNMDRYEYARLRDSLKRTLIGAPPGPVSLVNATVVDGQVVAAAWVSA